MISTWDEYPIHQAAMPILQPVDGDSTRYDRYFFHGYDVDRGAIFVLALGVYPNRRIIDAAFVLSADGVQRSVFASGRLDDDRTLRVGPISVAVVEPLRRLRIVVDAPEQGLSADLEFTARTAPLQEPRQTMMDGVRIVMDTCRFTQFGRWNGHAASASEGFDVIDWAGTRDRSWGIRPLAGSTPSAPAFDGLAGIWWTWAPAQFDDSCVHVALSEDAVGLPTLRGAAVVADLPSDPSAPAPAARHARDVTAAFDWEPGTRLARGVTCELRSVGNQQDLTVVFEPVAKVFMRGAGYLNGDWHQGSWLGESAVGAEVLVHADVDLVNDYTLLHVQHVCRTRRSDGAVGVGVVEHLAIGPHGPSGFVDFMDGAPA